MRKLLLITLEWPPMHGGISEYLSGLFGALPEERVAVLHDTRILERGGRFRWFGTISKAWRMAHKTGTELVAVSHLLPMGYVALILKTLRKTPYVVFVHGLDLKRLKRNSWKRFWGRLILRNAERVIANSEHTRSLAAAHLPDPERIVVIHPCPSGPAIREADPAKVEMLRERLGLSGHSVILSVCRLVERKGVDTVIAELEAIGKFCGEVKYLIVGDGPDRERLERLVKACHVDDRVLFAGAVDANDLAEYFDLGDVFVMLARETGADVEGFGIVYLEAGYHRLPVVAGRSGGVPEAVLDGTTGILVDPGGGDEFVSSVCRLFKDKAFAERLGAASRTRVEEEFTWARQALRFMEAIA